MSKQESIRVRSNISGTVNSLKLCILLFHIQLMNIPQNRRDIFIIILKITRFLINILFHRRKIIQNLRQFMAKRTNRTPTASKQTRERPNNNSHSHISSPLPSPASHTKKKQKYRSSFAAAAAHHKCNLFLSSRLGGRNKIWRKFCTLQILQQAPSRPPLQIASKCARRR